MDILDALKGPGQPGGAAMQWQAEHTAAVAWMACRPAGSAYIHSWAYLSMWPGRPTTYTCCLPSLPSAGHNACPHLCPCFRFPALSLQVGDDVTKEQMKEFVWATLKSGKVRC